MKKKWLIAIATSVMAVTVALGITACGENEGEKEPGKSDAEIAAEAIDTLKQVYPTTLTETPEDYDLLGQVNVGGERYNVIWTATSEVEGIENYVAIAKEMDTSKKFHVTITRGSIDVSYTMTASVTVGSETKTENFLRKIPKGLVADEGTVTVDFKDMDAGGGSFTDGAALALFNSMASEETPIESVSLTSVAHGNGTGAGSYQLAGGFVKMGTGSANGVLTLGFAYPVTKIEIEAQAWPSGSSTETLSVNSSEAQTIEKTAKSVYTFELATPTKDVTITTAGRVLVFKLAATWQKDVHHHTWTYTTGTNFQHTRTCTGADCTLTDKTETVDCQVVNSVCELCKKSYTQEEVVNALYELDSGASLPGTFVISGTVTEIEEAYSTTFYNTTFTINASGKAVKIFRAYGEICDEVEIKIGDTVTARGGLVNYSGDVYELSGGYITAVVDGSASMDDQTKVTSEKDNLTLDTSSLKKVDDSVTLPTAIYGTTLSWAISTNSYVKLEDGKLTVIALPESGTEEITVTATIKSGSVTETKEFKISIAAEGVSDFAPITAPAAGSDYYLAMDINGTWYYSTGAKSGNYLGTTTDISKAAKVTLAASGSGWTLVTNGKYIEFETSEPNTSGKTYVNIMLKDAQTEGKVWTWNEEHSVFTMDEGGETYFMGTYGSYNTFNSAKLDFIDNENEHIGKIGTYTGTVTPEPEPSDADATLSFADTANRTSVSTEEQVWQQNGVKVTVSKDTATSNVNEQYYNPLRIYQNHITKIEYTSAMTKVVFHCNGASYVTPLQNTLASIADAEVTVNANDVTITFETAKASVEFTATAQIRLDSIDVYSVGGAVDPDPDPDPDPEPVTNYGTLEDPLTVKEALALADTECATEDAVTKQVVYMTGVALGTAESKGNYYGSFEIADAGTQTKILVFSVNLRSGIAAPAQNDVVVICGYIKNYSGTIEFASNGGTYVYVEKNTRGESTITLGAHDGADVTGLTETQTKLNGTEVSFTVAAQAGKQIVTVKAGTTTLTATDGNTYKFTVAGNTTITVETADAGAVLDQMATLSFANKAQRTSYSTTQQIWEQNDIKLTNDKASSTNNVGDYAPLRCYQGSSFKVEFKVAMNKIVFHCSSDTSNKYAAALVTSIGSVSGVEVKREANDVTVTFTTAQAVFEVAKCSGQVRIDSLDVYYSPAAAATVSAPAEVALLPEKQY